MEDADPKDHVKHQHDAFDSYRPRWFSLDSLQRIDTEIAKGPFDEIEWVLRDERGSHSSPSLNALLGQVPYAHVNGFKVAATQHVWTQDPRELHTAHVTVDQQHVYWSAHGEANIEESRLARGRVLAFIQTLPTSGFESKFGSPPPSITSRLKRPPEGAREWLQMSAAVVVVGSFALALILKLAGAF